MDPIEEPKPSKAVTEENKVEQPEPHDKDYQQNEPVEETEIPGASTNRPAARDLPNPRPYATKTVATMNYPKDKYRKQSKAKAAARRRRRGW